MASQLCTKIFILPKAFFIRNPSYRLESISCVYMGLLMWLNWLVIYSLFWRFINDLDGLYLCVGSRDFLSDGKAVWD